MTPSPGNDPWSWSEPVDPATADPPVPPMAPAADVAAAAVPVESVESVEPGATHIVAPGSSLFGAQRRPAHAAPEPEPEQPAAYSAPVAPVEQPTYQQPTYQQPTYGQLAYDPSVYPATGSSGYAPPALPQPNYGSPIYPPGPPGFGAPPPGGSRPNRNKIIAAVAAVVVVAGLVVGGFLAFGGSDGTSTGIGSTSPRPKTSAATPSFPSESPFSTEDPTTSSAPTPTRPADATQTQLADLANRFFHALAANDIATFCTLADPTDIADVLKAKSATDCHQLTFASQSADEHAAFASLAVTPARVLVAGNTAIVTGSGITPDSARALVGTISMRRPSATGTWAVRLS